MFSAPPSPPDANLPLSARKHLRLSLIAVAAVIGCGAAAWFLFSPPTARLRHDAQVALARRNYERALSLGRQLIRREGQRGAGLLIVAESLSGLGQNDEAVAVLADFPADDAMVAANAQFLRGEIFREHLHHLRDAEWCFQNVLTLNSQHVGAHDRLAYLYGMQGRSWEAETHRLELIRHNQFTPAHLTLLALSTTADENPGAVEEFRTAVQDDPSALCGIARAAMRQGDRRTSLQVLRAVVSADPNLLQAQAWLGELLLQQGEADQFSEWEDALPQRADEHPEIWIARGSAAQQSGAHETASRCFWEAVLRNPNSQAGNYQLGTELTTLGRTDEAAPFLERARLLGELVRAGKLFEISATFESMRAAARVCEELGLLWEAWGWRQFLFQAGRLRSDDPLLSSGAIPPFDPTREREAEFFERLRRQLDDACVGRALKSMHPARSIDLTNYPLPTATKRTRPATQADAPIAGKDSTPAILFRDAASDAGIEFRYHNGNVTGQPLDYMYEFSGGGVGVIDFDGDGWPDLYLTQGGDWPPRAGQRTSLDRLYRNLGQGRSADVTELAGIIEDRFSQGIAVGDIDSDGFADLYVANIGRNRMYRNNGDGTFTERHELDAIDQAAWTTSCVMADFNGDTHPDIYCVNYVRGQGLFDHPCRGKDGAGRSCTPHEYDAADDQLFINLGDGRFADHSRESGILVPEGKGLGVVAADFDGSGRLSLFVANDAVPNFFFVNQSGAAGGTPRFEERGFPSGLAVDADGQAQACMGVAAGDADGDGLLDLFVTNFYHESNTLYRQQPGLLFLDATRDAQLRDPGFDMLGFGTQFLDADLDGLPDLVVTNGHVARLTHAGIPFEMRPQFFRNIGRGRFVELPEAQAGSFFSRKLLGRGLARLDWNRDGRDDFAVSHLESPAALVINESAATGNSFALRLHGVNSARDAIGTRVSIRFGQKQTIQQLVAGDGYQASNERLLIFGLRDSRSIDALEIHWPSGVSQRFLNLPANTEWHFIEGRAAPASLAGGGH